MIAIATSLVSAAWSWAAGLIGGRIWLLAAIAGAGLLAWITGSLIGLGADRCEARHAIAALAAQQQDDAENAALRARIAERERIHAAELTAIKERNDALEKALSAIKPSDACARCRVSADELRLLNR